MTWHYELFLPAVVFLGALAWFGHSAIAHRQFLRFATLSVVACLASSICLFAALFGFDQLADKGKPVDFSPQQMIVIFAAAFAASALAVAPVACLLYWPGRRWTVGVHVACSVVAGVITTSFVPAAMFVIWYLVDRR
jgi:hypothetical protein